MTRAIRWLRRPAPVAHYTPIECAVYVALAAGCVLAMALAYAS